MNFKHYPSQFLFMKTISICGTIILGSVVLITVFNKSSLTTSDQEDKMTTERSVCKSCQDERIIQDDVASEMSDDSSSDQKVKVKTLWIECGSGEEELDFGFIERWESPPGAVLPDSSH